MAIDRSSLTLREIQILQFVESGSTNREIGNALAISEGTVKGHLRRIFRKLRVSNRAEAAIALKRRVHRKLETGLQPPADV